MNSSQTSRTAVLREALREARQVLVVACGETAPYIRIALERINKALAESSDHPTSDRHARDLERWVIDNIYTIARREARRDATKLRPEMWQHVIRLCEQVGANTRTVGVLRTEAVEVSESKRGDRHAALLERATLWIELSAPKYVSRPAPPTELVTELRDALTETQQQLDLANATLRGLPPTIAAGLITMLRDERNEARDERDESQAQLAAERARSQALERRIQELETLWRTIGDNSSAIRCLEAAAAVRALLAAPEGAAPKQEK